jgi:hypothetical protein
LPCGTDEFAVLWDFVVRRSEALPCFWSFPCVPPAAHGNVWPHGNGRFSRSDILACCEEIILVILYYFSVNEKRAELISHLSTMICNYSFRNYQTA